MPIVPGYIGRSKTASNVAAGGFWTLSEQLVNRSVGMWTRSNPTYSVAANVASANEGQTILFTISTTEEDNGNVLYWSNAGTTVAADFVQNTNSGNITINNNTASVALTLQNDLTSEGSENIQFQLRKTLGGPVVASTDVITISDTSITPTYAIINSANVINEGDSVTFTVNTYQIPDGTNLYYTLSGVSSADVSGGSLSGSFAINSNTGSVTVTTLNDFSTEGTETLTFQLRTISTSGSIVLTSNVTINDTSLNPLVVDFLLVAGGGGGGRAANGNHNAGGGGAGGFVEIFSANFSTAQTYTITIGGGGSTAPGGYGIPGTPGGDSTIVGSGINYTAQGGGYGRGTDGTGGYAGPGGSGGGGNGATTQFSTYGYGYGYGGGGGFPGNPGGGGGAGGGGSASPQYGGNGNGGPGRANPFPQSTVGQLSSSIYYLAGGGGGHNGGLGGVGGGGRATPEGTPGTPNAAGTVNTGGGGGAGAATSNNFGAQGGSGVAVIRYSGIPKATGGNITQSGGYTLHTYNTSGTFTPT
jgi:hypothetical protein